MQPISRRSFLQGSAVPFGAALWGAGVAALLAPPSGRAVAQGRREFVVFARNYRGSFRFEPEGLALDPGDRVTWLNLSDLHTVTAYHPDNGKTLRMPYRADPWDSGYFGLDSPKLTLTHAFTVPGVYDYFCRPHELLGMVGRLVVGEVDLTQLPSYAREVGPFPSVEEITGRKRWLFHWEARLNAPVLASFLERPEDVEQAAAALLADFRAGADGAGELAALLREARLLPAFDQGLRDLSAAASGGGSYSAILERTDELRSHVKAAAARL